MAYGPVDTGSCFCEACVMLACFSRVAQSCSLLEMGTFPFLVRERLQLTANLQLGTARERSDRTRNGQLRLCRSTSRTVMLAAHVVNHKSSEASATNNCQLQAKRTWNYRLRRSRPGTYPCSVSERLQLTANLQLRTFLVLTLGR